MKKRILFIAYVNEGSIEAGHQLLYLAQIDIAYGKRFVASLFLELHEAFVFQNGDRQVTY